MTYLSCSLAHAGGRLRRACTWLLSPWLLMQLLLVARAEASTDGNSSRPKIRIAFFVSDVMPSSPIRYMLKHLDVPGRTLLPDYDIVVDEHPHRPRDTSLCFLFPCTGAVDDAPTKIVEILGSDTPEYHAIVGPFVRQEVVDVVKLSAKARVLHVHGGDLPVLSDRTNYPYSFRSTRSLQGFQTTVYHVISINGWPNVVSVWWDQDLWLRSNEIANKMNITNFPTLSEDGAAAWAIDAWQKDVVSLIRKERVRVAIVYVNQGTGWQLVCRVHRAELSGMQYFVDEAWLTGWVHGQYPPDFGTCNEEEMFVAAGGNLRIFHAKTSPGINIRNGLVTYPPVGGDQSKLPLTCMPGFTSEDFHNSEEHYQMAVDERFILAPAFAIVYMGFAGYVADCLCAPLLALHDAIYRKNVSHESIAARDPVAFNELAQSAREVDFQGSSGKFRYYEGTGDPIYLYWVLAQETILGRPNFSYTFVGAATFPDGPDAVPVLSTLDAPIIWRDGSTGFGPRPHLGSFPECARLNSTLKWDKCEQCPPGKFHDPLLDDCRTCPTGQYQNASGKAHCEDTPLGWYVPHPENPSAIAQCPAGHECPQVGTIFPQPCVEGRFAAEPGKSACELCDAGKYQSERNSTDCVSCSGVLIGSVTAKIASTKPDECICPAGSFKPVDSDVCVACPEGMVCCQGADMVNLPSSAAEASDPGDGCSLYPHAAVGYMTKVGEPLKVYMCQEKEHCPGGAPGVCGDRRDPTTVACGECMSGSYDDGDHCKECGDGSVTPFVVTCMAGVMFVVLVTLVINKDVHKTPASSMMILTVASLLFTNLQTMGVFNAVDVLWEEPVKTMMEIAEVMSFDLDLLKVSCVLGVNSLRSFALRQLLAVLLIPFIFLALAMKKYMPKYRKPKTQLRLEFINSVGTFYSVFFISILISALDPFICYEHPGGAGESVQSAPALLCFEGSDHALMIIIGMIAMCLVPLPFCGGCAFGVAVYPRKIKEHNTGKFLLATRFLFLRYVPRCYYFQIISLLRSFALCLVPAVFRGSLATQILFLSIVLGAYSIIVNTLQPWRVSQCNTLDACLTQGLVTLVLCGALFIEDTPQRALVGALSSIVVIGMFVTALVALAYALWKRLAPSCYHFFICHHKAHAAAQSRYMKMLLTKKNRSAKIFIDSDDLQELDKLFDTVKSNVRHLLVYLTADTLKRPWCVGEVVTAIQSGLMVTRLSTPSFIRPSEEQLARPETYVDITGCNLHEYGIEWNDVTQAFEVFLSASIKQVDLPHRLPGTIRFDAFTAAVLKQQHVAETKVPLISEVPAQGVVIVADPESDEGIASGGILVEHIGPDVYRFCEHGLALLCDFERSHATAVQCALRASVDIIVLSAGCLKSPEFLSILCEVMYAQDGNGLAPKVLSVNVPGFEFPSPLAIQALCAERPALAKPERSPPAEHVKAFFKRISILLATHASQHALEAQSQEVLARIQSVTKIKSQHTQDSSLSANRTSALTPSPSGASTTTAALKFGLRQTSTLSETETHIAAKVSTEKRSSTASPEKRFSWTWDDDEPKKAVADNIIFDY